MHKNEDQFPISHVKVVNPTEPWSPKGAPTWDNKGGGKVSNDFREEDYDTKKFAGELSTTEELAETAAKHKLEMK
jgi:hypothetical protein